jgi:hypothetical protein
VAFRAFHTLSFHGLPQRLGTTTVQVAVSIRLDQMPLIVSSGFPATQQVPLLPNAKWLAIGVQDANTGSFGTLQLAVAPSTTVVPSASAMSK